MSKLQSRTLDKTGQLLADSIRGQWPEWKKYLRVVPKEKTLSRGCLSLKIPCPNPEVHRGLRITTFGSAIFVEFDHDILHINDYQDEDPDLIALTVRIVEAYVTDRLLVVSWWQKKALKVITSLEPDMPIEKDDTLSGPASCRVRSWSGKYDRDTVYPN